jgi:hypothetical protein
MLETARNALLAASLLLNVVFLQCPQLLGRELPARPQSPKRPTPVHLKRRLGAQQYGGSSSRGAVVGQHECNPFSGSTIFIGVIVSDKHNMTLIKVCGEDEPVEWWRSRVDSELAGCDSFFTCFGTKKYRSMITGTASRDDTQWPAFTPRSPQLTPF